jgi:DNA mismatch repair ATPase MutS
MQSGLLNSRGEKASEQIKRLEKIADRISNRENAMFFPINVLLLWDYHSMMALERWKIQSGKNIEKLMETIGKAEALCSLAALCCDYPDWVIPEFTASPSVVRAKSLGHPLLGERKVCNDLSIEKPACALLITGSNMSGKSTYLRTAGINLVLAYAGAPVCASYMKCSVMDIHTCMRVNDNLEKNISSFYAEILRIKDIVNASKGSRQVFFLLDEIFKGTNSQDRHAGAESLIKNLCRNGAAGMVSTHDLELGALEGESGGQVKNYHFQEHYMDNEIHFDYKLRPGVSTTRNALYLIRMAGIDPCHDNFGDG